jgi:WhiB family redox-sensing transcriptional regulator
MRQRMRGRRTADGGTDAAARRDGDDGSWWSSARCAGLDPGMFFSPERRVCATVKQICSGCSVRSQCLEHAMTHGEVYGVWGGLTDEERVRLRRERRRLAT